MACLTPKLRSVPAGNWYCTDCSTIVYCNTIDSYDSSSVSSLDLELDSATDNEEKVAWTGYNAAVESLEEGVVTHRLLHRAPRRLASSSSDEVITESSQSSQSLTPIKEVDKTGSGESSDSDNNMMMCAKRTALRTLSGDSTTTEGDIAATGGSDHRRPCISSAMPGLAACATNDGMTGSCLASSLSLPLASNSNMDDEDSRGCNGMLNDSVFNDVIPHTDDITHIISEDSLSKCKNLDIMTRDHSHKQLNCPQPISSRDHTPIQPDHPPPMNSATMTTSSNLTVYSQKSDQKPTPRSTSSVDLINEVLDNVADNDAYKDSGLTYIAGDTSVKKGSKSHALVIHSPPFTRSKAAAKNASTPITADRDFRMGYGLQSSTHNFNNCLHESRGFQEQKSLDPTGMSVSSSSLSSRVSSAKNYSSSDDEVPLANAIVSRSTTRRKRRRATPKHKKSRKLKNKVESPPKKRKRRKKHVSLLYHPGQSDTSFESPVQSRVGFARTVATTPGRFDHSIRQAVLESHKFERSDEGLRNAQKVLVQVRTSPKTVCDSSLPLTPFSSLDKNVTRPSIHAKQSLTAKGNIIFKKYPSLTITPSSKCKLSLRQRSANHSPLKSSSPVITRSALKSTTRLFRQLDFSK